MTSKTSARDVPVIRLADLPALAQELAVKMQGQGFQPEVIVYVETGARLAAHELKAIWHVPLVPAWVRRSGNGVKQKLAPLARRLPVAVRDWLRKAEEASGVHRVTPRTAHIASGTDLRARRVLVFDDAADTGRTIAVARELALAHGAATEALRTAVLAATTPAAQAAVDFYVRDRNCRMPWSADSDELGEATARAARLAPPA